jgi:alpha-1,6-mannosyltransferase
MFAAESSLPFALRGGAWLTNCALLLFGLLYLELTLTGTHEFTHFVHGFSEGLFGQLVLYLGGIALVEQSPTNRWTLPIILLVAFGARLIAVAQPPFLSSDIYRYVWDGKVGNAGINPFRYIPADSHLGFLRDTHIYPFINRRDYAHTIYPPGSQFIFLVVARLHATVWFMMLAMVAFEAGTCFVLMRCLRLLQQPRERVLLYAWHPVCLWEIASSGHVDAAALTVIALAILARLQNQSLRATSWIGAAALIKLYPAALLPAFVRERVVVPVLLFGGLLIAGYLPFLTVGRGVFGFLPEYAREEGIATGARFFPLALFERTVHISVTPKLYIAVCAVLLAGVAWWAYRRGGVPAYCISSGLVLATALNLCFSPHYPWYFLWLLPFLTLWPWRPAFYLVLAATYMLATRLGMPGEGLYGMNVRLYGGFFLLLALEIVQRAWRRSHPKLSEAAHQTPVFAEMRQL